MIECVASQGCLMCTQQSPAYLVTLNIFLPGTIGPIDAGAQVSDAEVLRGTNRAFANDQKKYITFSFSAQPPFSSMWRNPSCGLSSQRRPY